MKRILTAGILALGTTGAAQAGSMEEPVFADPITPVAPPAPVALDGDWTAPYVGLSFGNLSAETDDDDDSEPLFGGFAGYDYDFGRFVVGGELEYQATDGFALGDVDVDSITRLKLRGGYDAGRALVYATLGGARADTSVGDADGRFGGLGVDFKVTESFTVGAEYLMHQFDDIGDSGVDVEADTISIRGAYRF